MFRVDLSPHVASSPAAKVSSFPSARTHRLSESRWLAVVLVLLLGLAAASPFATRRTVGSGEAYNYSLALADGVVQMRAGVFPPLVGQTEYAWNGRVHPLRDGPYLIYLARALDLATAQRLTFLELQNLSLALSLLAAAFGAYGAVRLATRCPPLAAAVLAGVYVLSPALMMAANVQDLFMTVHAAVFVPLAIALALRQADEPRWRYDMVLAAVLAAAWLAHPPVALWLTGAVGLVRLWAWLRHPSWHEFRGLALAAAIGLVLSAFVFASAGLLNGDVGYLAAHNDALLRSSTDLILHNLRGSFPQALLPVTRGLNRPGDLQLGYGAALLLGGAGLATLALLVRTRRRDAAARVRPHQLEPAGALVAVAGVLLLFAVPVPGLTHWLWLHLPLFVHSITNIWPTQRLYLLATALAVLAAGSVLPTWWETRGPHDRPWLFGAGALLLGWTLFQAQPFLRAGWSARSTSEETRRRYAPSNLDLTVTSYAFLDTRADFLAGASDPRFEFRILHAGREVASPLATVLTSEPVIQTGTLLPASAGAGNDGKSPRLDIVLQPGQRYVLTLRMAAVPRSAGLKMTGTTLERYYDLASPSIWTRPTPDAPPQHSFIVWTDQTGPETVRLELQGVAAAAPAGAPRPSPAAQIAVQAVRPGALPVAVNSIFPLRATVTAPDLDCELATCRRYVSGYVAKVNGEPVPVTRSPQGEAMIRVPRGRSTLTLDYQGSDLLRGAFWLSAFGWAAFVAGSGSWLAGYRFNPSPLFAAVACAVRHRRRLLAIAAMAAVVAGGLAAFASWRNYLGEIGPIYVRFSLPADATGRRQAIASMGRPGAGTIVLIEYVDRTHIRLAADMWGQLYLSPPIETDYAQVQEVVIDGSALYPLDHPAVLRLPRQERDRLRRTFRLELNGRTALAVTRNAFESKVSEVAVGRSTIGGSHGERLFSGQLLASRREPLPEGFAPRPGQGLQWSIPAAALAQDQAVPLFSLGPEGRQGMLALERRAENRLQLEWYLEGKLAATALVPVAPRQPLTLRCAIGRSPEGGVEPVLSVALAGQTVFGPRPERLIPPKENPFVLAGVNPAGWGGLPNRFNALRTGPEVVSAFDPRRSGGLLSLAVLLPSNRLGRAEPLLVSGKAGVGDLVYIVYSDERHVRFGVDHWGRFGQLGEPIAIDYSEPHLIRVSGGPASSASATRVDRHPPALQVELDGRRALEVPAYAPYPNPSGQLAVAENTIGASTCDPRFTGSILELFRGGSN